MRGTAIKVGGLFVAIILLVGIAFQLYLHYRKTDLELVFKASVYQQALVFNEYLYDNPGGPGRLMVRDFRLYLSNVALISVDDEYYETESYHLARFDNDAKSYVISLPEIPRRNYTKIRFSIGVDEEANLSRAWQGDLDPNGKMAWNWEVGYKFVLVEGSLLVEEERKAIIYHVGFSENLRKQSFMIPQNKLDAGTAILKFDVDIMKMFQGNTVI
ncbi:MAG: MbnP family protein, partial [Sneathiella sp.]